MQLVLSKYLSETYSLSFWITAKGTTQNLVFCWHEDFAKTLPDVRIERLQEIKTTSLLIHNIWSETELFLSQPIKSLVQVHVEVPQELILWYKVDTETMEMGHTFPIVLCKRVTVLKLRLKPQHTLHSPKTEVWTELLLKNRGLNQTTDLKNCYTTRTRGTKSSSVSGHDFSRTDEVGLIISQM